MSLVKTRLKTTSESYGRTKENSNENSFCFVWKGKFILCDFAYAYVASEKRAAFIKYTISIFQPTFEEFLSHSQALQLGEDENYI